MSYCPKCGRKIYEEKKGCEFCGVINDSSHWESKGGNQVTSLDYDFSEKEREENTEMQKKDIIKSKSSQETGGSKSIDQTGKQEDKEFPGIAKFILIVMMFLIPWGGFLIGIVLGFLLKNSPYASFRAFGNVLLKIALVLVIIWVILAVIGLAAFTISL